MDYSYNDFKDETNSRKRAMEALKKARQAIITPSAKEEVSGGTFSFKKLWAYVTRKREKSS